MRRREFVLALPAMAAALAKYRRVRIDIDRPLTSR